MKKGESTESGFKKASSAILALIQIATGLLKFIVFVLIILFLFGMVASFIPADIQTGNVAVIPIEGVISTGDQSFSQGTNSNVIVDLIDEARENSNIKAILLDIDSPGGTPVATDEISQALKEVDKPVVAVIRETGASGAFWIATSADYVFANRMSVTGSIGVTASRLEFGDFLQEHNVTYRRLAAGKYKDIGTIWREMTPEELAIYQEVLDKLHDEFIKSVAENRELDEKHVRSLATGMIFLGEDAKEFGFVDELGNKKDAIKYIEHQLNITAKPVEYSEQPGFFEEIAGLTSNSFYQIGRGLGSSLENQEVITLT